MKKIVILHTIEHFNIFQSERKRFLNDNKIIILAFTIQLRIFLQKKKIPYIIHEKYISEEDAVNIDRLALYLNENWDNNIINFNGISFGLVLRKFSFTYFSTLIRDIHVLLKIVEHENPIEFISIKDENGHIIEFNHVLEYVCKEKKIPLKYISKEKKLKSDFGELNLNKSEKQNKFLIKIGSLNFYKIFMKIFTQLIGILYNIKKELSKKSKKKKTILMYGKYYYHSSVVNEIPKRYNLVLLDDRPDILKKKGFAHLFPKKQEGLRKFLLFYDSKKIQKKTESLYNKYLENWKKISKAQEISNKFVYYNFKFWPIFEKNLNHLFLEFRNYIKTFLLCYKVITKNKYDLIIFEEDYRPGARFLSILANIKNIPSFVIQHGITGHYSGFVPTYCSKIALWGKISKEYLSKYGLSNNKAVITGSPRFDDYIKIKNNKKQEERIKKLVYDDFKIDITSKLILFTSTFNHFYKYLTSFDLNHIENEEILLMIMKLANNVPNVHLIIKLHPGDFLGKTYILEMKNLYNYKNISITSNYNTVNLIASCDCLISGYSTTTIEAAILYKPLIIINFKKSGESIPLKEYNIGFHVSTYEELENNIIKALNEPVQTNNYEKFLEGYLYKIDGQSTRRILDLIDGLLDGKNNSVLKEF